MGDSTDRRAIASGIGWGTLAVVGGIVAMLIIATLWIFGVGMFQRKTANFRGQTSAIEKTKANADFRIKSYNEFFDLCGQVQALEDRATIQREADDPDAGTNLRAILSSRATLIREYNAKAARGFTEGQFRAASLPFRLDVNAEETTCDLVPAT